MDNQKPEKKKRGQPRKYERPLKYTAISIPVDIKKKLEQKKGNKHWHKFFAELLGQ